MESVFYEELCPQEFAEAIRKFPAAFLPLGTLEWHGYHMPLGADAIQSRGAMVMIAKRVGGIVLPTLFLGPDLCVETPDGLRCGMDVHSFEEGCAQQLAGSAYYMEDERFAVLLDCAMRNLARAGFKIVVAHGHGPSTIAFASRKAEYLEKYGLRCSTLFDLGYTDYDGLMTDHAAANETSITMALRPELVHMERLPKEGVPVASWGRDPRRYASAEFGRELLEKNVEKAVRELEKLKAETRGIAPTLEYTHVRNKLESEN